MRPYQASEIGEVRQAVLTSQQQPAELLLKLVHGARQCRLRNIAVLCRAREVQGLTDRQEVADLVYIHAEPSSTIAKGRITGEHWCNKYSAFPLVNPAPYIFS